MDFPKLSRLDLAAIFIAALALVLRILWIGRTDSTGDEIFGVKLAFKISLFLAHYWYIAIAVIAAFALLVWLVGFRKDWKIAAVIAAGLVAVQVFTNIPLTLHISNGPMIYIANAFTMLFTGLSPQIAGELTVTFFMALMAVAGYFLAKEYVGKEFAWIAFAALLASPLGTFLGATDFAYGMSDSLMYIALALFLLGLKKRPELISLAGIAFALSMATRYPPMLMAVFFAAIIFWKRKLLWGRDYRPALLCFLLMAGGTAVAYGLEASNTYHLWNSLWVSTPTISDKPHFSVFLKDIELGALGADGKISDAIYPLFVNFFYTPAVFAFLAIALFALFKGRRKLLGLYLALIPAFLLVFTLSSYRRPNYVNTVDFAIIFAIIIGLAYYKRIGKWLALAFAAILLLQSAWLFSQHSFTGFSQAIEKIPEGSSVFASFYDGAIYYSGNYKADTQLGNAFFSRLFAGIGPQGKERIKVLFEDSDFSPSKADFVILEEDFVQKYSPESKGFVLCGKKHFNEGLKEPVVEIFANSAEKCAVFKN